MRVALHSTIRPGAVEEYRAHHAAIPDDLARLFERAGIHDWSIWRSGDRLFHLVDCDDFDAAIRVVDDDPANEAWQSDIGRYVAGFLGPDGEDAFAPLEPIWSLGAQRSGT